MAISTDALVKGNQLIHEYVNSGKHGLLTVNENVNKI